MKLYKTRSESHPYKVDVNRLSHNNCHGCWNCTWKSSPWFHIPFGRIDPLPSHCVGCNYVDNEIRTQVKDKLELLYKLSNI